MIIQTIWFYAFKALRIQRCSFSALYRLFIPFHEERQHVFSLTQEAIKKANISAMYLDVLP